MYRNKFNFKISLVPWTLLQETALLVSPTVG